MAPFAFNSIYGPLSDRNTTKAGSVQGLAVSLVTEIDKSMVVEVNKKLHKDARTDVHPIFTEMVRGTLEIVHSDVFNKHIISSVVLDDKETPFNFTEFVQDFAWELAAGVVIGHELPPNAKGITAPSFSSRKKINTNATTAQYDRFRTFFPMSSIVIESGSYLMGRTSFHAFSRVIARTIKVLGIDLMPFLRVNAFVGPSKGDDLGPEHPVSSFKGNLTTGKLAEVKQKPTQIDENLVLFMGASYDTSSSTVISLFYYLMCHRQAFLAVREELKGAFQTLSEISDQRLIPLVYLNACLNETLRLSPPVNGKIMQRVSLGMTIDGIYVPKGVAVSADTLSMHRSSVYWDQPESFRPERWINKAPTDEFRAFRPFGSGNRICPGRMMALQSARLTLAKIVWLYDLEMVSDPKEWQQNARSGYLWEYPDLYVNVSSSGLK
ncbi:cytochrome P450 monooxygenase [Penicillium brevicompactum]|uniref:Cytochrome P450 monooxygenase n=1 Tax=Penicillium brevicompactum TaxID=5074 RepID=A0A9W9RDI6_PENBR|nr:cytochrome P450 monooxygenase [Penicillium brevicompactum]